ncbi:hypothetical protein DOTSEDRAFT_37924 [Dothistroma septosporum NZE10]|uniref:Uncharacterized protein n=1 Tax=Dothistroma septosporum (strain NZE10 / CBS 128990) TaxID=675120 RepID=N1PCC0_DOTSN|nr:hypothetical protein DOTSEDRAFT_37924 [Dothistroma septosporum NZE10]
MYKKSRRPNGQRQRSESRWGATRSHDTAIDLVNAVYQMARLNSRMDRLFKQLHAEDPVVCPNVENLDAIHDDSDVGGADEYRAAVILLDAILAIERNPDQTPQRRTEGGRPACPAERLEERKRAVVIKRFNYAIRRFLKYRFPTTWERILGVLRGEESKSTKKDKEEERDACGTADP